MATSSIQLKKDVPCPLDTINGSLEENMVCKICLKSQFKYTCPRCNIVYCSLACYKDEKHMSCSEAFYKDCVIQELQEMKNVPEDKEKVIEMLKRDLEDKAEDGDEEDESNEGGDLATRLEGLDLDKDIGVVWSRLSMKEKEEFARMFQDGRLANLIEIWTPWWKCRNNLKLVQENVKKGTESSSNSPIPELIPEIPDISKLFKNSQPSANLRYDLLNVLFAYAFVTRMHNGSHQECPVDSCQLMLEVCSVLGKQDQCGSVGEAIQLAINCVDQVGKKSKESSSDFNLSILEDIEALIVGPNKSKPVLTFMSAVLSDLARLFQKSLSIVKKELRSLKPGDSTKDDLSIQKQALFKAERKVHFLLSWLQRYGMGVHQLLPLLSLEREVRHNAIQEVKEIQASIENNMNELKPKTNPSSAKCKIEELS